MLAAAIGLFSTSARAASASDPQFRLFLTNGTVLACLGEFARVGDRVVFTLPLGEGGASQLMSLPASRVDWPRTEAYSDNLRAVRYADVRGELDFSALAGDVAGVLNEIAFTKDPGRRLQLALQARRRLETWPRDHYNYRASDVAQIVQLVDEAISEMRAAAGEQKFDLNFVANVETPPPGPLLPPPTPAESLTPAATVIDSGGRFLRAHVAAGVAGAGHRFGHGVALACRGDPPARAGARTPPGRTARGNGVRPDGDESDHRRPRLRDQGRRAGRRARHHPCRERR